MMVGSRSPKPPIRIGNVASAHVSSSSTSGVAFEIAVRVFRISNFLMRVRGDSRDNRRKRKRLQEVFDIACASGHAEHLLGFKRALCGEGRDGGRHQHDATVNAVEKFIAEHAEWRAQIAPCIAVSDNRNTVKAQLRTVAGMTVNAGVSGGDAPSRREELLQRDSDVRSGWCEAT